MMGIEPHHAPQGVVEATGAQLARGRGGAISRSSSRRPITGPTPPAPLPEGKGEDDKSCSPLPTPPAPSLKGREARRPKYPSPRPPPQRGEGESVASSGSPLPFREGELGGVGPTRSNALSSS